MTPAPELYFNSQPLRLAEAPHKFSFSALTALRQCPRRWQLENSTYPGLSGCYPSPYNSRSAQGQVVHALMKELIAWLIQKGSPPLGTREAGEALKSFDFKTRTDALLERALVRLRQNPRAWRETGLGIDALEVRNTVLRLLRSTWEGRTSPSPQRESHTGDYQTLGECLVEHPTLPLKGILDLVQIRPDGDWITDYKSGEMSEAYRDQIALYGLLWWRARGRLPALLRVVPVSGRSLEVRPTEPQLLELERRLGREIDSWRSQLGRGLVEARPEPEVCRFCAVRQLCDAYWEAPPLDSHLIDRELRVTQPRSDASLTAVDGQNREVDVLAEPTFGVSLRQFPRNSRIRVLRATLTDETTLTLTRASEIYL
ncbi:MAG: hypothetical protein AMXMBFR33_17650 [Candidatus Xenobia bacterium]